MNILCIYYYFSFNSSSLAVSPPNSDLLKIEDVFDSVTGKPKHEVLKEHFTHEGRVEEAVALRIINEGNLIFNIFIFV